MPFITMEGIEGVGKTTLTTALVNTLRQRGLSVLHTREPGGTPMAETIRQWVLHHPEEPLTAMAECCLLLSARAQHVSATIMPALANGQWVICERFHDATIAYQGYGRHLDLTTLQNFLTWVAPLQPERTFWLDAPIQICQQRVAERACSDIFEQQSFNFFNNVQQGYHALWQRYPERIVRLDATQPITNLVQMCCSMLP
jgi:dTMP kinase